MQDFKKYRETEVLTAREIQTILKVGNKTVYRLFSKDCPFRVIKIPGGYRLHTKSFLNGWTGNRNICKNSVIPQIFAKGQIQL